MPQHLKTRQEGLIVFRRLGPGPPAQAPRVGMKLLLHRDCRHFSLQDPSQAMTVPPSFVPTLSGSETYSLDCRTPRTKQRVAHAVGIR